MKDRLIIYGGSFDPPTISHYKIIDYFKDNILVCLTVNHAFKSELTSYEIRKVLLTKLFPNINIVSMNEYMYDFLQSYNSNDISILIGSDILDELHLWQNYEYLIDNYHFTIIERNEIKPLDILEKMKYNIIKIDDFISTSSTEVKNNIKNISGLVPEIIREDVLYYYDNN